MNNLEFAAHFADHAGSSAFFILLSLCINIALLRRYIYSVFDPLLFYSVLSAMGGAVVYYLYYHDLIGSFYFTSYILTQAAFLGGFLLIRPARSPRLTQPRFKALYSGPIRLLYPLCLGSFVISQLIVYSISGIPLLLESRLEAFATGGGYGLFSRIIFVTSIASLAIACYRLFVAKRSRASRRFDSLVILFCIVTAVLSGSKAALLSFVFTISLALFFAARFYPTQWIERRVRKFLLVIMMLSLPAAIATIYIQSGIEDFGALIAALMMRFLQTGDIYFMVYPDGIIRQLPDANGLLALFYSPLGSLRIFDRQSLPLNLGLQAFWYHYDTDLLSGPNARHNVFGLHYFGFVFSVVFSFSLGLLFSFIRNDLYRRLPPTPVGMVFYVLLVMCAVFIEQDVAGQAIEYLFSVALVFTLIYVVSAIICPGRSARPPAHRNPPPRQSVSSPVN